MGIEIDQNDKPVCSPTGMLLETELWIVDQLTVLAEAFGEPGEKLSAQRLQIYACDLADLDRSQLDVAFRRARREGRFFPKIAELRQLAGASAAGEEDAEAIKAWDVLTQFVRKYVGNDVYGNFGPEHGWHPRTYPKLSDRILDTVRRTGGWKVYACMTGDSFPFQQRRFLEQYKNWSAVDQIPVTMLLAEAPRLQLVAKPMDSPKHEEPISSGKPVEVAQLLPKRISTPLTDEQRRDRLEVLRQQLDSLAKSSKNFSIRLT